MTNSKKPAPERREQLFKTDQSARFSATAHLILVIHAKNLSAWQASPNSKPKALFVKGDMQQPVGDTRALENAHADVAERLRQDGVNVVYTHCIADAAGRQWFAEFAAKADRLSTWQLLAWEWMADRFGLGNASPWDATDSFTSQVLPWLITADDTVQRQHLQRARESEHHNETGRLAADRETLAQENDRLRTQNAALQQVDAERLVSFLPALYPSVFTVIGPVDLALLCGRVEPMPIPNPYPEPSEEALRTIQRRFRDLPHDVQRQIVRFVADQPHRRKLQSRPEMRELVYELEKK